VRRVALDYPLPPELIAQERVPERSAARLFVLDWDTGGYRHLRVSAFRGASSRGTCSCGTTRVLRRAFAVFGSPYAPRWPNAGPARVPPPLALSYGACERRSDGRRHRTEATMGDKSPKSKERGQKQKNTAKAEDTAAMKAKQASHTEQPPAKGRK
jgi:hypothetical protein